MILKNSEIAKFETSWSWRELGLYQNMSPGSDSDSEWICGNKFIHFNTNFAKAKAFFLYPSWK